MKKYKVITLCGSLMLAKELFPAIQIYLERKGHVIFGVCPQEELALPPTDQQKLILDKVHFKKILLSDLVLVLDINGYIGESTRNEIQFAELNNIEVVYLRDTNYFNSGKIEYESIFV